MEHGITPQTIKKELNSPLGSQEDVPLTSVIEGKASRSEIEKRIKEFEKVMKEAAKAYDFERAAEVRDIIFELKAQLNS